MLNYQRVFLSHWLYHVKKLEDRRKMVPSARKMIALGEPVPLVFSERIRYMDYGHPQNGNLVYKFPFMDW